MFIFYLGCCFGSFLTVIASRLPVGEDFIFSRSGCHHCKKKLAFYELIPLFSILSQSFRCRTCQKKIPFFYFSLELLYGSLFYLALNQFFFADQVIFLFWFTMAYLLSLTDYFYLIVEPKILYPFTFLLWLTSFYFQKPFYYTTLILLVVFAVSVYFFFFDFFGFGDCLLLLAWGPWLPLPSLAFLLACASCAALLLVGLKKISQKDVPRQIPFVPYLSLGLVVVLLFL